MPFDNRAAQGFLHLECLGHQHGRLVGETHALQVAVRIETRAGGVAELSHQCGRRAPAENEFAQPFGFSDVAHAQVLATGVGQRLRGGGARFLVIVLAVNDHGVAIAGVEVHFLPDVEHAAAGGVDQHASLALEVIELGHADPKRRQDHDVSRPDLGKTGLGVERVFENLDAQIANALVDVGVVDDLARQKHAPIRKPLPRLVGVVDGAIHAVTKAEFPGQADAQSTRGRVEAQGLETIDRPALIGPLQHRQDLGFQAQAFLEISL